MLRDRLHVSERWACQVVEQHRSTQRREPKPAADDEALRGELRAFSARRPRWGYRQAHTHLRDQGARDDAILLTSDDKNSPGW